MDYIQSILIIALEVICCKIFYESFANKRHNNRLKNILIFLSIVIAIFLCAIFFGDVLLIKEALIMFVSGTIISLYVDVPIWRSISISLLFQGLLLLVDYVYYLGTIILLERIRLTNPDYSPLWGVVIALSKLSLFLTFWIKYDIIETLKSRF